MKRLWLAALTAGLMSTPVYSANVEFRGYVCLLTVTPACTVEGWSAGNCGAFRYRPPNLGDNGPQTRFSYFDGLFAENYTLQTGSLIGTVFRTVQGTGVGSGGWTFTATMRFTSQTPAALAATSPTVTLQGNIRTFDGIAGCDVSLRASGPRLP
jgi:hypothetical protein